MRYHEFDEHESKPCVVGSSPIVCHVIVFMSSVLLVGGDL